MGTTDIPEPEVKEVKPASRPLAAVLPKSDFFMEAKFTPRPMFADSILEFGQQKKRQSFCHVYIFCFELHGHRRDADHAAAIH